MQRAFLVLLLLSPAPDNGSLLRLDAAGCDSVQQFLPWRQRQAYRTLTAVKRAETAVFISPLSTFRHSLPPHLPLLLSPISLCVCRPACPPVCLFLFLSSADICEYFYAGYLEERLNESRIDLSVYERMNWLLLNGLTGGRMVERIDWLSD